MIVVHDSRVMNDRLIDIGVVNYGSVHVHDRGVVSKVTAAPFTADKADSHEPEAVVHAAVVANMQTPVAIMEKVVPTFPAPIRRRPKIARLRSRYPCAGDPIVAILTVGPVARRPQVSVIGAWRLHINRQHRRRNVDADKHSGKRRRRNDAEQCGK